MKKIVLVYGLIAGVIVGGMLMIMMPLYESGAVKISNGELIGYTTMVIALSLIFFAVKSYRDRQLNGVITFGKALQMGLLITLVAGVVYILCWEVTYQTMETDFLLEWSKRQLENMRVEGASEAEIAEAKVKYDQYNALYKNFVVRAGMTLMEIAPVGIVLSLLSAALLRKKSFLPSTEN